jgi:SAM-dependent methyltransferase
MRVGAWRSVVIPHPDPVDMAAAMRALRARARDHAAGVDARMVESYRDEITAGLADALERFQQSAAAITGGDPTTADLAAQTAGYVQWMQWALWDLPAFAAAIAPPRARFRRAAAACGFLYLAFRIVDDVLDRHYLYRERRPTLLATFTESHGHGHVSEAMTVLAAFLLCFDGLEALLADDDAASIATLRQAVRAARRAILGAILERSDAGAWTRERYERLIALKNVEYSRVLAAAVDPDGSSPLQPFLTTYYALAQRLNDVQDHSADDARGQPNFLTVLRASRPAGDDTSSTMTLAADAIGRDFIALDSLLETMPAAERSVAALKLGESLDEAFRLGLFGGAERSQAASPLAAASSGLAWDSPAEEVVERLGPDALEDVGCAVCGSRDARLLFRKDGFAYRRCAACSHVYVSPRVTSEVQARIAQEMDGLFDDPFLDVQRIQAESLCRVLERSAHGPHLLDVGFGRGYLMHMAHAHGFEAYGADHSPALIDALRPVFGRRLARATLGDGPLPWSGFDVLVLSHVLEHLMDPAAALGEARKVLNADGLLYVAVPDIGSVQFRVFGKRWNAISPIVHPQYFTEASLRRLLGDAGFDVLARVDHGPEPPVVATPATRLFRALGGTETGELALLCRPAATHADPA